MSNKSVYRSYGFWMSLSAAILLVVKTILNRLGIEIDQPFIEEIISGVLAVLVILGIIAKPKDNQNQEQQNQHELQKEDEIENYQDDQYLIDKTVDKE
ncbi:MAG TPA: phage holin [Clostridia bacterium]